MPVQNQFKKRLIDELEKILDSKITSAKQAISSAIESRDNETKSSVGDKYETGRAMMQMEIEKNQVQLLKIENQKNDLFKINFRKNYELAEFGSLVFTNSGNYFLSIPFGKLNIENVTVFCISIASPIGKILSKKRTGDNLEFLEKEITIQKID